MKKMKRNKDKKDQFKTCHCHTCGKKFHSLGIARHRAMHREKKEYCEISYYGQRKIHDYSK